VLASTLAINSGGALAVLNVIGKAELVIAAASSFAVGILLSIASAFSLKWASTKSVESTHTYLGYWISVIDDGIRDKEVEDSHDMIGMNIGRRNYLVQGLHVASVGAFLLGVVMLGVGAERSASRVRLQCKTIEATFSSDTVPQAGAISLFQALGCRPQGNASVYAKPTKLERLAGHALPEGGWR